MLAISSASAPPLFSGYSDPFSMTSSANLHEANILVVDDCPDNALLLVAALNEFGFSQVAFTTDPGRVFALHAESDFDLILLDMHMPRMNGLEVMRQLREIEKNSYLPVLAMTGDSDLKIAALKAGARDFIMKPFDLDELNARACNIVEVRLLYKAVNEQNRIQSELAMHDALTGLPNRRLLLDRTERMMQHTRRAKQHMALLYLDLDGFKQVNDEMGHPCGDDLLKMVAQRLLCAVRHEDTASRLGGDEFVLLLSDIADISSIETIASKILDYLSTPFEVQNQPVHVTTSIGVALYPDGASDEPDQLIAAADQALYQAKRAGKNRFHIVN
jgi:two-component system, cell cycle response regulator